MNEEVKRDDPAWLCCPLMSGQAVPVSAPIGAVLQPGQTAIAPMMVPCCGNKCPLFDTKHERCALYSVVSIADNLNYLRVMASVVEELKMVLEPATKSPIGAIADSLSEIVLLLTTKKGK